MSSVLRLKVVEIPSIREPIQSSPGFDKKGLSKYKLDILGLCGFGCCYCSSNHGNYLRINRQRFAELAFQQLGEPLTPADDPYLTYEWPDVLDRLKEQLARHKSGWGKGQTCVFSMLTDGFSPRMVQKGVTEAALRLVLEKTDFRIRVLTKNSIVGTEKWVAFFKAHPGRFVVGLSTGTIDDSWAKAVEIGTSVPSARIRALHQLQDAGVPTFGMLCPIFPDMLAAGMLEKLVDAIRPHLVEHVWAEPFNDRANWEQVRAGYAEDSPGYAWFGEVYGKHRWDVWSAYATELYTRLRAKAQDEGWLHKLRYLLYEDLICQGDAARLRDLAGVWLQSKPAPDGKSQNQWIAAVQTANS